MAKILDNILQHKRQEIALAQAKTPLSELKKQTKNLPPTRDFHHALTKPNPRNINVIAEIKRASPSAGLIRPNFNVQEIARIYHHAGADAISVLTDREFFRGNHEYIRLIRDIVPLPILCKDFFIDPYQIYQARLAGADAILLIAEALTPNQLMHLLTLANSLTLTVLIEFHELDSLLPLLDRTDFPRPDRNLLGINNRNLKTMQTDIKNSLRLRSYITPDIPLISESGVKTRKNVTDLIDARFSGILIGETLMKSPDIRAKFDELFTPQPPSNH